MPNKYVTLTMTTFEAKVLMNVIDNASCLRLKTDAFKAFRRVIRRLQSATKETKGT